MEGKLTLMEFNGIRKNLERISDTWADLWVLLNLTQVRVTQLLSCRYLDIHENIIILPSHSVFTEKCHLPGDTASVIIERRRKCYPNDIFLFQSHSPRVKAIAKPVTLIAFNSALKKAALGITHKTVSSKSALLMKP